MKTRKIEPNVPVEFDPPATITVVFGGSEVFVLRKVTKAEKDSDGTIFVEMEDQNFAEIRNVYKFLQIGSELENE